jgi:hypothetical protein
MQHFATQFSPAFCYFLPIMNKCPSYHVAPRHPGSMFSLPILRKPRIINVSVKQINKNEYVLFQLRVSVLSAVFRLLLLSSYSYNIQCVLKVHSIFVCCSDSVWHHKGLRESWIVTLRPTIQRTFCFHTLFELLLHCVLLWKYWELCKGYSDVRLHRN